MNSPWFQRALTSLILNPLYLSPQGLFISRRLGKKFGVCYDLDSYLTEFVSLLEERVHVA